MRIFVLKKILFFLLLIILFFIYNSNFVYALDDIIYIGDSFSDDASQSPINEEALRNTSNSTFHSLFVISMAVALITGVIMGIKFFTGSVEQQVKIKETLIPYITGVFVVTVSFTIWKNVINIGEDVGKIKVIKETIKTDNQQKENNNDKDSYSVNQNGQVVHTTTVSGNKIGYIVQFDGAKYCDYCGTEANYAKKCPNADCNRSLGYVDSESKYCLFCGGENTKYIDLYIDYKSTPIFEDNEGSYSLDLYCYDCDLFCRLTTRRKIETRRKDVTSAAKYAIGAVGGNYCDYCGTATGDSIICSNKNCNRKIGIMEFKNSKYCIFCGKTNLSYINTAESPDKIPIYNNYYMEDFYCKDCDLFCNITKYEGKNIKISDVSFTAKELLFSLGVIDSY